MAQEKGKSDSTEKGTRPRYQVRLPGFIPDEEIGLGDVIKRARRSASATSLSEPRMPWASSPVAAVNAVPLRLTGGSVFLVGLRNRPGR
jgi:hypothetical protein